MILANHGIVSSSGGVLYDADALAFITAASITDNTQKTAVNTLVTDLKTYNIWTKMKALYPFVGGTASQHRFNLKDPRTVNAAFYLDFLGGGSHSNNGYQPNGTTAYADTKFTPSSVLTTSNIHISYYSRTDSVSGQMIGLQDDTVNNASQIYLNADKTKDYYSALNNDANSLQVFRSNTAAYYTVSRLTSTDLKAYKGATQEGSNTASTTLYKANISLYLGGFNYRALGGASSVFFGNKECAFSSIGDGLTSTEVSNLYTAVQAYQTTLGRNV